MSIHPKILFALHFIGDIPEFSNIYVLSGEPKTLLSCIGRRLHMGAKSNAELKTRSKSLKSGNTVIGTSSLGEITSNDAGLARLHSMSLVVSSLSV